MPLLSTRVGGFDKFSAAHLTCFFIFFCYYLLEKNDSVIRVDFAQKLLVFEL